MPKIHLLLANDKELFAYDNWLLALKSTATIIYGISRDKDTARVCILCELGCVKDFDYRRLAM